MSGLRKSTRREFLAGSAAVAAGMVLAACSKPTPEPTKAPPTPGKAAAATSAPTQPAPTAVPTKVPPTPTRPPVEITWHHVPLKAADIGLVNDAASQMLQAKGISAKLKLVPYTWTEFNEKVPLMLASGEPCDLVFSAWWTTNNIYKISAEGQVLPLDDLLPKYAPETWASLTKTQWNAARATPGGGPIICVPNLAAWLSGKAILVPLDILKKYPFEGWDKRTVIPLKEWEPYMEMVLSKEPGLEAFLSHMDMVAAQDWGYDSVANASGAEGVLYNDPNRRVVNTAELPEFLEYAKMARKWVEKRYVLPDGASLPLEERTAKWKARKVAGGWNYWDPGEVGMSKPENARIPTDGRWTGVTFQTQSRAAASNTCVAKTCKNPEIAVQIINQANSNPEFYNLISYGIEGKHWVWVDKKIKLIGYPTGVDATSVGYSNQWWAMGSIFNGHYWDRGMAELDSQKLTKKAHDEAPPSVILGFVLNPKPVEAQVAQPPQVRAGEGP